MHKDEKKINVELDLIRLCSVVNDTLLSDTVCLYDFSHLLLASSFLMHIPSFSFAQ